MKIHSRRIRWISFLAAAWLALPLSPDGLTGLYLWASPFLFLNALLSWQNLTWLHGLSLLVLLLVYFKPRWFCRYVCPVGALCDAASGLAFKNIRRPNVPAIHKGLCLFALTCALLGAPILAITDPLNLFYAAFDGFHDQSASASLLKLSGLLSVVFINVWIPHVWRQKICPLGGLQDWMTDARHAVQRTTTQDRSGFSAGRRHALTGLAGALAGLFIHNRPAPGAVLQLRPPGALEESQFRSVCTRCGNCVKACPTSIIHSSLHSNDWLGALTPVVRFQQSYCLPECTRCGEVCPSGAISAFTREQKKRCVIGVARIHLENCLLVHLRECDRCKAFCDYDAIAIESSDDGLFTQPKVIQEQCVGCGACQIVCPAECIEIEAGR